jgi:MoaA/NifB/PqqE/SkfB family radical SAM enzyme
MAIERNNWPILAQWDITTGCNFSCSFCLTNSGIRLKGELKFEDAKIIIDKLYSGGIVFLRILGGEPFFRKDILKLMQYAANRGMLISFSTNASLINEKSAKMLKEIEQNINYFQISLYGVDKESYVKTTKRSNGFQLVNNGIKNLKKFHLNPYAFWVLTADNVAFLETAYQLVKEWELPALRISPKLNLGRASNEVHSNYSSNILYWQKTMNAFSKLRNQVIENGSPQVQLHARPLLGEFLYKKTGLPYFFITCKAASTMVYVNYKGDVSPCPFADFMPSEYCSALKIKDKKINLLNHSLAEIWQSDMFKIYRRLQNPDENPNNVFKKCPHLVSGMCNPCIYTPCTCGDTIRMINQGYESTSTANPFL